jgi:hypothetical protein
MPQSPPCSRKVFDDGDRRISARRLLTKTSPSRIGYGFCPQGIVRSRLAGGPIGTYKPGETWFEPPGVLHLFAENASNTEPAELLAIFVADDNCGPLVIYEP